MLKKLAILILFVGVFAINAQEVTKGNAPAGEDNSKYTVVNAMISQVIQTAQGLIVTYKIDRTYRTTYIPNKFFTNKTAVRIDENDTSISPQMSIILKDGKPHRVKLYLATKISNMTYRMAELLTPETVKKFEMEELTIEF